MEGCDEVNKGNIKKRNPITEGGGDEKIWRRKKKILYTQEL